MSPVTPAMNTLPMKIKIPPIEAMIPNLSGLHQISLKASIAAKQKFLPVIAI